MQDEMLSEPSQQQPKAKFDQVKSQSIFYPLVLTERGGNAEKPC